jgi:hypothetical protein
MPTFKDLISLLLVAVFVIGFLAVAHRAAEAVAQHRIEARS